MVDYYTAIMEHASKAPVTLYELAKTMYPDADESELKVRRGNLGTKLTSYTKGGYLVRRRELRTDDRGCMREVFVYSVPEDGRLIPASRRDE